MISIGANYGGPELDGVLVEKVILSAMSAIDDARGNWTEGSVPTVNVVFHVPGSIVKAVPAQIEPARLSRKQRLLLVAVPVPPEMINSDKALDFVIDALHKANAIAAEVFAKKNVGTFDLQKADAIVAKARAEIATGRYDKQVADAIATVSKQTQAALDTIARVKEGDGERGK